MALAKEGEDWFLDSRFGEVSKYVSSDTAL
jgi:hypothetical protein